MQLPVTWLQKIEQREKPACVAHQIHVSEGRSGHFFYRGRGDGVLFKRDISGMFPGWMAWALNSELGG